MTSGNTRLNEECAQTGERDLCASLMRAIVRGTHYRMFERMARAEFHGRLNPACEWTIAGLNRWRCACAIHA
jgi:hypothetical protein